MHSSTKNGWRWFHTRNQRHELRIAAFDPRPRGFVVDDTSVDDSGRNLPKARFASDFSEPSGVIKFTTAVATSLFALRPILPDFIRRYPKIQMISIRATTRSTSSAEVMIWRFAFVRVCYPIRPWCSECWRRRPGPSSPLRPISINPHVRCAQTTSPHTIFWTCCSRDSRTGNSAMRCRPEGHGLLGKACEQ